jgi:hypothetical protein
MANQTIPNLPAAVSLNGTEQIWANQAGTDVRITTTQIATLLPSIAYVTSISFGTMGFTPSTAATGAVTVAGTLNVANGGTGDTTLTANGVLLGNGASPLNSVSPVASGSVLASAGVSSAPAYTPSPSLSGTVTAASFIANEPVTSAATAGAFSYGTIGFSDTNLFASLNTSVNGYVQTIVQNASSAAAASADIIVSNDQGTATTYYGDFGINSSGFSGTGSLALPSATYLYSANGDLTVGTYTSNAIHFVVNNGASDAMTVSSAGLITANSFASSGSAITGGSINSTPIGGSSPSTGSFTTLSASSTVSGTGFSTYLASPPAIGGSVAAAGTFTALNYTTAVGVTSETVPTVIGGTAAGSSLTLKSTSGVGTTDSIVFKTGNNGANTALSMSTTGNVSQPLGFYENAAAISTSYTLGSNNNAMSAGPVTISATVTVNSGSVWVIV